MSQEFDDLVQRVQDLQDAVQALQDDDTNLDHEARIEALEGAQAPNIDLPDQSQIENTLFNLLQTLTLRAGLPIYTSLRDLTNNPPRQGEIWLEDISGVRKFVAMISGTTYKITIT